MKTSSLKHGEIDVLEKIERAFQKQPSGPGSDLKLAFGDDAALLKAHPRGEVILTCDWFLEGSHFLRDKHPADSVGWKCLARAMSDIAAMGGYPTCFLLSLGIPDLDTGKWLDKFLSGLRRASRQLHCPLAGGDTTRCDEILINITVVGTGDGGRAVLRSGTKVGDLIYVSGALGEAEAGLRKVRAARGRANPKAAAFRKHFYPVPRLALGQWLREKQVANAMMDLSDGLSSDLPRLCAASGVGAKIKAGSLPLPKGSSRNTDDPADLENLALHGGDDYELLFTVSRGKAKQLPKKIAGVSLTCIGEITAGRKIMLLDQTGRESQLPAGGWDPFRIMPRQIKRVPKS